MANAYWFYGGSSTDLIDPTNWWDDALHTTPFSGNSGAGYPGASDDLFILGNTMPASNSGSVTAINSWNSGGADTGTTISGATSLLVVTTGLILGVSGDATSAHTWDGSVSGTVCGGTIQGGAVLNLATNTTFNALTVADSASVVATASLTLSTTTGDITFSNGTTISISGGSYTLTISSAGAVAMTSINFTATTATLSLSATSTITLTNFPSVSSSTSVIAAATDIILAGTTSWVGDITCSGDLTLSGTATAGAGTYTVGGNVTVGSGTTVRDAFVQADFNITVVSGATIDANTADVTLSANHFVGSYILTFAGTITGASGHSVTLTGGDCHVTAITYGVGGVVAVAAPALFLSGNVQWTGNASIGGNLSVSGNAKFVSGNLTMSGGSFTDTASAGGGLIISRGFNGGLQ